MNKYRVRRAAGAALALLLMVMALAGCSQSMTPEQRLQASMELSSKAQSMEADMITETQMSLLGQTMQTTTTAHMVVFNNPVKLKMEMEIGMGEELGSTQMEIYAQTEGDDVVVYSGGSDAGWTQERLPLEEFQEEGIGQYDATAAMELYAGSATELQAEDTELDGVKAVKITGVISGEAIEEVIQESGITDSLAADMDDAALAELLAGMYEDLEDIPVVMYLDAGDNAMLRMEMDMSSVMASMMTSAMETVATGLDSSLLTVDNCRITIDFYNYDKAEDFVIPAEAMVGE